MKSKDYNNIDWCKHFYLDVSSPSGLRWAKDVWAGTNNSHLIRGTGSVAGTLAVRPNGTTDAWRTTIKGERFSVSRIIWCITYGSIDSNKVIDHINGDPSDNSMRNLRLVSIGTNNQNKTLSRRNYSGTSGVYRSIDEENDTCKWVATWKTCGFNGKKTFSIKKYGEDEAFRLACEHRNTQIDLLNENGANYTDRHTTTKV